MKIDITDYNNFSWIRQVEKTLGSISIKSAPPGHKFYGNQWTENQYLNTYDYQDRELEHIPKQIENRAIGVALEASGDIIRELALHPDDPGVDYLKEKITKVVREVVQGEREFTADISDDDQKRLTEYNDKMLKLPLPDKNSHPNADKLELYYAREQLEGAKYLAMALSDRNLETIRDSLGWLLDSFESRHWWPRNLDRKAGEKLDLAKLLKDWK